MGFTFNVKFKADIDSKLVEAWLQELNLLLRENHLALIGGWNADECCGFIMKVRGSVTPAEWEKVEMWLEGHKEPTEEALLGELMDAWN